MADSQASVQGGANNEPNQETKTGRKRSRAWDHFTLIKGADGKDRSQCNYCSQTYACHTKSNGTTSMLNHIEKQCKKIVRQEDSKQKTLSFKPSVDGDTNRGLVPVAFSVEACRKALAEMIVIDELPFKFVENEGFRRFLHVAVPRWTNLPNRNTIKEEILKVYESEKAKLKRSLRGQRVCLTTDTWTSCQNLNYMCLTAHFIDGDWNYQKRVLNFGVVESHKGEALGRVLEDWLHDWHLDRILTITVDNASSNNLLINYIKRRTTHRSETLLKHEYLHMRCCAHILNLIVREGLKEYDASIAKIRTAVKYVRSSPPRYRFFQECARKELITNRGVVCLDVTTRWNYTYLMLEKALIFRKAFKRMDEDDPCFGTYLIEEEVGLLNDEDWEKANLFFKYLKIFYEATCKFSGSQYVTLNSFFGELLILYQTINMICMRNASGDDACPLKAMAENMKLKFTKYWGNFDKVNLLLYMGIILDPRFKLRYLEFNLKKLLGEEGGKKLIDRIDGVLHRLYDAYVMEDSSNSGLDGGVQRAEASSSRNMDPDEEDLRASLLSEFTTHMKEANSNINKSDLEKYLLEDNEDANKPLDILMWWKVNASRFSVLSLVAREVLAIPVSTVASESVFSTGGRVIDHFRSSLAPSTVEALICTQNWLRSSPIFDVRSAMDEIEELEKDLNSDPIMEEADSFEANAFDSTFPQ